MLTPTSRPWSARNARVGIVAMALPPERPDGEGEDERARDQMIARHIANVEDAIRRADASMHEIKRALGFPLARSTRLEEDDEPAGLG